MLMGMPTRISSWAGPWFRKAGLSESTSVELRSIKPSDVAALQALFAELSTESRYLRFHAHVSELSPNLWESLACVDGRDHVAIAAWCGVRIVGVARFIRLARGDMAEIAFVVSDDLQQQ